MCERQGADEGQVVLVGVGEHGVEVVRAVVGALEAHVDTICTGTRLLEHLVQQGASPAGGRDGVVAPGLAGRQRPHLEPPVAGAFERDRALVRRHGAEVVERQGQRVVDRAADLERAVVDRQREVAAHVVELDRGDLPGQGFGRRLRVVRSWVDHLQRGARAGQIVCDCHVSVSCRSGSVVGVAEGRVAIFVEGADAFDAIGMHGRAPMRVHHDRDRLLGRLPLAEVHGPFDGLDRRG